MALYIMLPLISKDIFLQNNLERIHISEIDYWMIAVYENRVISIKLMKRLRSTTYMFHP
jgi:hypothetical protein